MRGLVHTTHDGYDGAIGFPRSRERVTRARYAVNLFCRHTRHNGGNLHILFVLVRTPFAGLIA